MTYICVQGLYVLITLMVLIDWIAPRRNKSPLKDLQFAYYISLECEFVDKCMTFYRNLNASEFNPANLRCRLTS